jgi:hypothetical protein
VVVLDIRERAELDIQERAELLPAGRKSRKRVYMEKLLGELLIKPFELNSFKAFAALFSCDAGYLPSKDHIDAICEIYSDCINSCEVIAGFTGSDGARVALIAVKLNIAQYTGRSGSMQRCFVSRLLTGAKINAAVAAFYCGGEQLWRLSFVRQLEDFDENGVMLEYIPVKRCSFLAGEGFPHHLVQKRLHKLFLHGCTAPSLDEIEQVFSQQDITGEFIKECCSKLPNELLNGLLSGLLNELSDKLSNELSNELSNKLSDKLSNELSNKLSNELQNELPNILLDKLPNEPIIAEILNNYGFSIKESESYDEIAAIDGETLGKLFESLLSGKARKRSGTFYTPSEIVRYMCIESISNYLSNKTEASCEELRIFLQYGEVLADEDCRTPVGISAGEAAEESAINPGAKCKLPAGVFCRLNEIDEALADMKVLDPAAGAGAFPLCMLNEIVNARLNITEYLACQIPSGNRMERANLRKNRNQYILKQNAIKNSIYAADIDVTAASLTKLRLWLSLASAYGIAAGFTNTDDYAGAANKNNIADNNNTAGMPELLSFFRLECNVVCADSLLDEIKWPNWPCDEKHHFDIVIGNPPYISAIEGSRKDSGMREALRGKYPLLKGAFDIYTAFLLEGVERTTKDGVYCWIIPNKFLVSGYAAAVLNFMKHNGMRRIVSISDIDAFSGTGVYPIIVSGNRRSSGYGEYIADSLHNLVYHNIKPKIKLRSYKTFADFGIRFASGATGFQARLLSDYITEHAEKDTIPFIVSGSADKFHINYSNVRYMGRTYRKAFISKGKGITENKWNFWCSEKIVIAGLTRVIEAVYCAGPLALGVGVYAINGFAGFDPFFLLGLLNSKFISWYLNMKFSEKHLAAGYLAINKSTLEQLPLVYADENLQLGIAETARRIQESAAIKGSGAGIAEPYMAQLDEMAYGLYGLEPSEIKVVEDFFKSRKG